MTLYMYEKMVDIPLIVPKSRKCTTQLVMSQCNYLMQLYGLLQNTYIPFNCGF